jgi:pimeloyl-ACP methyl ester carboxylesterase
MVSNYNDDSQVKWAEGAKLTVVRGNAKLTGPRKVRVEAKDGSVRELEAKRAVVLATGSRPRLPDIPGLKEAKPWDNREGTGAKEVPKRLVVLGGGAVAVELAQERPLAGVVLESTFTSVDDMAKRMVGPLARFVGGGFASVERIPRLRAPLLFFHGDRDDIVPIELGRALFDAAPEPKRFEVITGAGHNDTVSVGGRAYLARIGSFLDEVAP